MTRLSRLRSTTLLMLLAIDIVAARAAGQQALSQRDGDSNLE
jgi:hypothetical protein